MKKKKIIAAMMSAAMLFSVVTPYLPAQAEEEDCRTAGDGRGSRAGNDQF